MHASTQRPPCGWGRRVPRAGIEPASPASKADSRPSIGECVGVEGIEPPSAVCRTTALPLDETPVGAAGVEPAISCSRNRRLPIKPSRRDLSIRAGRAWLDARYGDGIEVMPAPTSLRVSLQPGDEPLRARSADRHVGTVIVAGRRVERAAAAETLVHGFSSRGSPGNRTLFFRVRTGSFASKAWDPGRACRRLESNQLRA